MPCALPERPPSLGAPYARSAAKGPAPQPKEGGERMAGLLQSLRRAIGAPAQRQDMEASAGLRAGVEPADRRAVETPAGPARAGRDPGEDEEYAPEYALGPRQASTALAERERGVTRPEVEDDGVYVKPTPITSGQQVTIWYCGLLARHGADQVYLHYGFGPGRWQNVQDVPMQRVGWIGQVPLWQAQVKASAFGTLEFCFHDSADHWDNNSGHNWVYQIHWGART